MDNPKLHNKEWRGMDIRHDTELWGFEYDVAPYLEHVSDGALDKRYINIINNVNYLVCDLRDLPPVETHFVSSWWWLKVKFHTEREYSRRNRALPTITSLPPAPGLKIPYVPSRPNESNFIVKYEEASWLTPLFKDGIIEPGSPWENGYNESFNGRLRDTAF